MANPNRPSGFIPVKNLNGAPWNGQANLYSIAASYGTALYIGDPVISSGTADTNGVPGIALAAATGAIRGVIVGLGTSGSVNAGEGLMANVNNLNLIYRPASDPAVWYAMVVDDPNVIFEIQEHAGTQQLAATETGLNQVPYLAAGNGFVSGWLLASYTDATPATTATLPLRLLGLVRRQDNAFGAYAKWLVQINVHELAHGTGAAGV
jgi:hypothetical protein